MNSIKKLIDKQVTNKNTNKNKYFYDSVYNLSISENSDGSGVRSVLNRSYGNLELLTVIANTLQKQLDEFKKMFDEL